MFKKFAIISIKTYRLIFSYRPRSCRYHPSCSEYAEEAIERYGAIKGIFLAIMRIIRCNPYFQGGYDPVK